MYLRTTKRRNGDGTEARYYQLAENEWDADRGCAIARVIYNFGRAEQVDAERLRRLAKSILRSFPGNEASDETKAESGGGHREPRLSPAAVEALRTARPRPPNARAEIGRVGPALDFISYLYEVHEAKASRASARGSSLVPASPPREPVEPREDASASRGVVGSSDEAFVARDAVRDHFQRSVGEDLRAASELRAANDALRATNSALGVANDELSALMNAVASGGAAGASIVVLAPSGRLQFHSPSAARILGIGAASAGLHVEEAAPEHASTLHELASEVFLRLVPGERVIRGADGKTYRVSARPHLTPARRVAGTMLVFEEEPGPTAAPRADEAPPPEPAKRSPAKLTAALGTREREILALVATGLSSKEIASRLRISVATVDTHRRNIVRKLHVSSIAALARLAVRDGLVTEE